ncbi:MAG: rod shape-determining protein MreC [Alloprevotella sp.]|nr:rod shape-determining protein MreC [Alloprevotella sp.]
MKAFLDFLVRFHHFFLFLLLEAVSLLLLFRFNSFQGSVWFTAANGVAASVNRMYGDAVAYTKLQDVNKQLTANNVLLSKENELLREQIASATADTTQTFRLMQDRLRDARLIAATVVSNSTQKEDNYLVIDRGEADGIRPEMGVVGGNGVVGIVYLTSPHYSLVVPIINQKSTISCRVRGTRYFGSLTWEKGNVRRAFVDDIPRYASVQKGSVIETSGYSSIFPPGLFVGRVSGVRNSPDGQSYRLDILLGTNFANIRDVFVISNSYKAEIDTLQLRAYTAQDE